MAGSLAGTFTKGILGVAETLSKSMKGGVTPEQVMKTLAWSVPVVAAMQLMDLSPTGEVVGTYLKNKLVPGLEEANLARQMELDARMEMGAKQLPGISANAISLEQNRMQKQQLVQEALARKEEIVQELEKDSFLIGIPRESIARLVDNVIQIAPMATVDNPAVILSVIRSAALTGADSIDISTANELMRLENQYTGRI